MKKTQFKTYSSDKYLKQYMEAEGEMEELMKKDLSTFFIVRVEDMIRAMKLPVPPYKAPNHTLIFLTDGSATMSIGSQPYTIRKNECLVVAAGQVFSLDQYDDNKGFLCHFNDDFIIGKYGNKELLKTFDYLHVWSHPKIGPDAGQAQYIQQVCSRLLEAYNEDAVTNADILQSYFVALLFEINKAFQPSYPLKKTAAAILTNNFRALIFAHIREKHLVSDYAALLHVSPNHLNKTIKAVTGISPTRWIDNTLILEAKVLLYQTQLSINDIAANLGIDDASYFTRLFRKYEGVTPTQFRKMIEKS